VHVNTNGVEVNILVVVGFQLGGEDENIGPFGEQFYIFILRRKIKKNRLLQHFGKIKGIFNIIFIIN